jgi:hypothetical protein
VVVVQLLRSRDDRIRDIEGAPLAAPERMRIIAMLAALLVACTPDTTSFRSTERIDSSDPELPSPAVYDLENVARVRVWSGGGYIGTSQDPMTHVGIAIQNIGKQPVIFDDDAVSLALYGEDRVPLPAPELRVVVPLGPSKVVIAPGERATFELHFKLGVKLARVAAMTLRWSVMSGGEVIVRTTDFVRDDEPAMLAR